MVGVGVTVEDEDWSCTMATMIAAMRPHTTRHTKVMMILSVAIRLRNTRSCLRACLRLSSTISICLSMRPSCSVCALSVFDVSFAIYKS